MPTFTWTPPAKGSLPSEKVVYVVSSVDSCFRAPPPGSPRPKTRVPLLAVLREWNRDAITDAVGKPASIGLELHVKWDLRSSLTVTPRNHAGTYGVHRRLDAPHRKHNKTAGMTTTGKGSLEEVQEWLVEELSLPSPASTVAVDF